VQAIEVKMRAPIEPMTSRAPSVPSGSSQGSTLPTS